MSRKNQKTTNLDQDKDDKKRPNKKQKTADKDRSDSKSSGGNFNL